MLTLSIWDTGITKEQDRLNGKVYYTVRHGTIVQKDGSLPRQIVILDTPADDQYISFANPQNNIYYSRNYEACLAVVDLPEPEEVESQDKPSFIASRFLTSK